MGNLRPFFGDICVHVPAPYDRGLFGVPNDVALIRLVLPSPCDVEFDTMELWVGGAPKMVAVTPFGIKF